MNTDYFNINPYNQYNQQINKNNNTLNNIQNKENDNEQIVESSPFFTFTYNLVTGESYSEQRIVEASNSTSTSSPTPDFANFKKKIRQLKPNKTRPFLRRLLELKSDPMLVKNKIKLLSKEFDISFNSAQENYYKYLKRIKNLEQKIQQNEEN